MQWAKSKMPQGAWLVCSAAPRPEVTPPPHGVAGTQWEMSTGMVVAASTPCVAPPTTKSRSREWP